MKSGMLINRNFALLWSGGALSYLGDAVFNTTLLLWIAVQLGRGQSWAPVAVSGVLLATLLPDLLVGPIAGVFVDRWDKRQTMLVMDAARAVLIAGLLVAAVVGPLPTTSTLIAIYAVVLLATVGQNFFGPSRTALIGDIVPEAEQGRASGLSQITATLAFLVGPPIAAPLLFTFGVRWALAVNAVSFAVSFITIALIHAPMAAHGVGAEQASTAWREFTAGLHFVRRNTMVTALLLAIALATLGAGALNALDVFFVTQNLHVAARLYGWLDAAFGVGALLGGVLVSVWGKRIGYTRLLWGGLLGGGAGIIVYSRLTAFAPALVLLGVVGVVVSGMNIAVMPLVLQATPRTMIGRVMGVIGTVASLASIGSIAIAGLVASTVLHGLHLRIGALLFGPVDTVFTGTGVIFLFAGVVTWRRLRQLSPASAGAGAPEAEAIGSGAAEGTTV